jgi:hypothetical protein
VNTVHPVTFGPYTVSIDAANPEHAVIRRADGAPPEPTWYELQHMKCLAFGSHARAVEVFPAQAELYDTANMRHLWAVPAKVLVPNLFYGTLWE